MSTISSIQSTATAYAATKPVHTASTSASRFSQTLAVAQAPKSWLISAEASQASRPNIKEFMDRTGAEFLDASELLYGVVGSNTDVRDWSAIMASADPVTSARQATGQMYGRTDITPREDAHYMGGSDTVAQEGNFAIRLLKDEEDQVVDQGLKLIDAQGLLLRDAGSNPETMARNAWLFGFDTQPLARLAEPAAAVSQDLGLAVQQASVMASSQSRAVMVSQAPVVVMAADNASFVDLPLTATPATVQAMPATVQASSEPVVVAQADDQATSPTLEQVLQDAAASAFEYIDTATYLSSVFRA